MARTIYRLLSVTILICLLAACGSDELEQQITALTTERDALKEELGKVKEDMTSTVTELTGKLETVEAERNELATAHEAQLTELTTTHEARLETISADTKKNSENLVAFGISLSAATAEANDLKKQLKALRAGKSLLGARLADAHIGQHQLRNLLQSVKASKSLVGAALSRVTEEKDHVEEDLQLAKALRSRLGATLADHRIAQDAQADRLDTMKALRSRLGAHLADNRLQQDDLESELTTARALRSTLGAKLADKRLQQDDLENRLATTRALRSRLGAFLANADLKQQSTEEKIHQVNWERDKALDQWQAVQTELSQSSLEHTDNLKQIHDQLADSAATIDKLSDEKADLVIRMAGAAEARDGALAQWKVLHDRLDELTQKIEALESKAP